MSAARHIIVLEDPASWAGIEQGSDKVLLVTYCDGYEIRVRWDALAAIAAAQHLGEFGHKLLAKHVELVERPERNNEPDSQMIDRLRPDKLDA